MNENSRCACGHPDLAANMNRQFQLVRLPDALVGLLHGRYGGKRMVRIA